MINPNQIKKIEINFIPKEHQRLECYRQDGCADYYFEEGVKFQGEELLKGTLIINVSRSKSWRPQWLVLLHEIIELAIVLHSGISFKEIDRFDQQMTLPDNDPGSLPYAPYHKAHMTALKIEKIMARKIGIKWGSY